MAAIGHNSVHHTIHGGEQDPNHHTDWNFPYHHNNNHYQEDKHQHHYN